MKKNVWLIMILSQSILWCYASDSLVSEDTTSFEYWFSKYNQEANPERANQICVFVIDSIEKNNLQIKRSEHKYIVTFYYQLGNLQKAEEYCNTAIDYANETNDTTNLPYLYLSLSAINHFKGLFSKCVEYAQLSFEIAERNESVSEMIYALTMISDAYMWIRDDESSNEYILKAIDIAKEKGEEFYLADLYRHYGFNFTTKGEYDKALEYHRKAEDVALKYEFKELLPLIQFSIGIDYYQLGHLDDALENMHNAFDQLILLNNYMELSRCSGIISDIYRTNEKYDEAEEYSILGLKYAILIDSKNEIANAYFNLGLVNYYKENYVKGLEFLKKRDTLLKEIEKEQSARELRNIQASFELELKNKEADILKKENEIERMKVEKLNSLIVGLVLFFILLGIAAVIYIRRNSFRTKQRISKYTQQNLRFQMNPHFIFNTLNSIQYILFKKNNKESNFYLTKFGRLLNMVLQNSKKELVSIREELEVLNLYLELEKLRFKDELNYRIEIDENIDVLEHKIPPMLIQPFIENSIIHGIMPKEEPGTVSVNLNLESDKIICCITDDGIGRKKASKIKNSQVVKTRSLGTKITENRLELISLIYKDKLSIIYHDLYKDGKAIGTKVQISFPAILQ